MYVIRHGHRGRVVVHRADCGLLDTRFYEVGEREHARTFAAASARAEQLTCVHGHRAHLCGWCRPSE
jgi:hypothetical protein